MMRRERVLSLRRWGGCDRRALCYRRSKMLLRSDVPSRRFTRAFVAVALFTVIVLVCIEAIGVCPLVH